MCEKISRVLHSTNWPLAAEYFINPLFNSAVVLSPLQPNPATPLAYKWVMSTSQIIIKTMQYFCLFAGTGMLGFLMGRYGSRRWPKR